MWHQHFERHCATSWDLKYVLCVADSGSWLSALLPQPHHQPAHPNTHPLRLCCYHPDSHTSGLAHGRGRGCTGGLRSGYHSCSMTSWILCPKYSWRLTTIFFFFLHEQCLFFQGPRRNLRNDLLIAADSITSTMSSLVKELNSGNVAWLKSLCFVCRSWW